MADEIQKITIDKLEDYAKRLAAQGDRDSANDALLLTQLIATLRANAHRDILIASMAAHIDELERRFNTETMLNSQAYQALLGEFRMLQRHQDDLRSQVMMHAAIIDVGIEKISAAVRKIESANEALSESVEDLTEP